MKIRLWYAVVVVVGSVLVLPRAAAAQEDTLPVLSLVPDKAQM